MDKLDTIIIQVKEDIFDKKSVKELEKAGYSVIFNDERKPIPDKLKDSIVGIILPDNEMDESIMKELPNLKVVSRWGVGYDNVDISYTKQKNIKVTNTPGTLETTTAQLTITLAMNLVRNVRQADNYIRNGTWKKTKEPFHLTHDFENLTYGVIGLGRIGKEVAILADKVFGDVYYYDPMVDIKNIEKEDHKGRKYKAELNRLDTIEDVFKTCNIVSIHCPLNSSTRWLIGDEELILMSNRKPSYLINMARGEVLQPLAVHLALKNHWIDGVALDVFANEPLDKHHFLTDLNDAILTPHIGSATYQSRKRMSEVAVDNTIKVLQDKDCNNIVS